MRHRVDYETMTRPKDEGGLGVLSVTSQVRSLVAKYVLFAIEDGDHLLQDLQQSKI